MTIDKIEIEYFRINIEDNSDVPIKLSFPVAYNFLENAFNECKLSSRNKTKRNNALVESTLNASKGGGVNVRTGSPVKVG